MTKEYIVGVQQAEENDTSLDTEKKSAGSATADAAAKEDDKKFSKADDKIKNATDKNFDKSASHTPSQNSQSDSDNAKESNDLFSSTTKKDKSLWEKITDRPKSSDPEYEKFNMYDHFLEDFQKLAKGSKSPDDLLIDSMILIMCLPFDSITSYCKYKTRKAREKTNGKKIEKDFDTYVKLKQMNSDFDRDGKIGEGILIKMADSKGYKYTPGKKNDPLSEAAKKDMGTPSEEENKTEHMIYSLEKAFKDKFATEFATEIINENIDEVKKSLFNEGKGITLKGDNADELRQSFMTQMAAGKITKEQLKSLENFSKNMGALEKTLTRDGVSEKTITSKIATAFMAKRLNER